MKVEKYNTLRRKPEEKIKKGMLKEQMKGRKRKYKQEMKKHRIKKIKKRQEKGGNGKR